MRLLKGLRKIVSLIATTAVIFNSLAPSMAVLAARNVNSATLDGTSAVTVSPSATISANVNVTTDGTGQDAKWQSTGWRINATDGPITACVNTPDHQNAGTYSETFNIVAPTVDGTYNTYFTAYNDDACSSGASTTIALSNSVIVSSTLPTPTPTATPTPTPSGNSSGNIDQCRNNGVGETPVNCDNAAGPLGWENGNAGSENAHYVEGQSIPYRLVLTDLSIGTHNLKIEWDVKHSSHHAIDYITSPNRIVESVFPCDGVTGCTEDTQTLFAIPAPSSVGSPVAGQPTTSFNNLPDNQKNIWMYNGTISSMSYVSEGDLSATQSSTQLSINFAATSSTVVLAWGGHIGSRLDWGFDTGEPRSAGGISGSPYHSRFIELDEAGGNQDRSLSAGAVLPPTGSITIVKDSVPDGAQDFSFTTNGTGLNNFSLDDDTDETLPNLINFSGLSTGSYSVTETSISGWRATNISCTDPTSNSTGDTATRTTSINLGDNENVICTFVNTQDGKIIVEKQTLPDGSSQSFNFTANYDASGFSLTDGLQNDSGFLVPGTYSVSETPVTGWDQTSATCSDGSSPSSIGLAAGEVVTCTFTNTQRGHIIIDKVTIPSADTQNFTFSPSYGSSFGLTDVATPNDSGAIVPGTYSVSETVPSGWDLTGIVCTDPTQNSSGNMPTAPSATISVAPGETVTCTFTNTKRGHIIVDKVTLPAGDSQSFSFTPSYGSVFGLTDLATPNDSGALIPGTYSVSEGQLSGWDLTSATCSDQSLVSSISLQAGETVTCTFNNTKRGTIFGYKYEDANGDGTSGDWTPVQNWVVELWKLVDQSYVYDQQTTTNGSGYYTFSNLILGSYQVKEQVTTGWTSVSATALGVTLTAGENDGPNNFVNFRLGQISGKKYADLNGNGEDDNGEPSLSGWTIYLDTNNNGQLDPGEVSTATLGDGSYAFSNLGPGSYVVREINQTGWGQTDPTAADSSIGGQANGSYTVTMTSNGNLIERNFGNQVRGSIQIIKNAVPNDGQNFEFTSQQFDTFYLDDDSNVTLPNQKTFSNLGNNTYSFTESSVPGWELTDISCNQGARTDKETGTVNLTIDEPGENIVCTFTNTKYGSIKGRKYNDINGNGDFDESEKIDANRLDGWTINLYEGDGVIKSMETGDNSTEAGAVEKGQYKFVNLLPGTYDVCEVLQTGWTQTEPASGSSQDNETYCHTITLSAGQAIDTIQFGNFQLGTVSGYKWKDINGDGIWQETEDPLENWSIHLGDLSSTTDSDGYYEFVDLFAGTYALSEALQPGWSQTHSPNTPVVITSGTFLTDQNFGNAPLGSIHGIKWNDLNGDGERCSFPILEDSLQIAVLDELYCEPLLGDWTVFIDKDGDGELDEEESYTQTQNDGVHFGWYWFTNLMPGTYRVCEVQQSGWGQTFPTSCHTVQLPDSNPYNYPQSRNFVDGPEYNFGNQESDPAISIEKSNDRPNATAGNTVNYTLVVTNDGNVSINNVTVTDFLPGGFSYVDGTTVIGGVPSSDPIKTGNKLEWNVGTLGVEDSVTITYQVQIAGDATDGIYKNFATCSGEVGGILLLTAAVSQDGEDGEIINCLQVDSSVTIGHGTNYGGNLLGQVLGISTELPATGSPTVLLIGSLALLGAGLILNSLTKKNKAVLVNRKTRKHAKK